MLANFDPYYVLARELGLHISPAGGPGLFDTGIHVNGTFEGRIVAIRRHIGRGPFVAFRAPLDPALDLGLSIRPSGTLESLKEVFGAVDVEVGDPAFDEAFALRADEPARATAFLQPSLRAAILACRDSPLAVHDDEVVLTYPLGPLGFTEDDELLRGALRSITSIAHAMEAARAATPPATDVAPLVASLQAFARERNLACAFDTPTRVAGTLAGLPTWVAARRRKKGIVDLEIGVRFEQPLGFHFGVTTARTGLGTWLQGEDLQVGDAGFDRAFDVLTEDREALLALLDEGTRATLLELGRGRTLRLDGTGLRLSDLAADFDPAALPAVIETSAELVKHLARRVNLPPEAGYR